MLNVQFVDKFILLVESLHSAPKQFSHYLFLYRH